MNRYGAKARVGAAAEYLARALTRALGWSLSASRAIVRPGLLVALLIVLGPIFLVLTQSGLHAIPVVDSIVVTNLTDPVSTTGNGFCTLREAINNANAEGQTSGGDCAPGTGNDDITFNLTGPITPITLAQGALPSIVNTLTIDGTGYTIAIDGAGNSEILYVDLGATLTLNDLTIENGSAGFDGGGGVYNLGTLTINNSTLSGNLAEGDGGGIISSGTLTVTNSTFSGNSGFEGGGIYNEGITLTVTNSTFYDNSATFYGGGIFNEGSALTVTNSTFSGNSVIDFLGGGIYNDAGTTTVKNSILATDTPQNCAGTAVTDGGYNIADDGSCGFSGTSVNSTNPRLATAGLANNGGPTETIALQLASPAVDAIPSGVGNANCPGLDQRGDPRPAAPTAPGFSNCDIGAYELQPIIVTNLTDPTGESDNGFCTLREAINNANSPGLDTTLGDCGIGTGNDDIIFRPTGPITPITLGTNGTLQES